MINYCDLNLRTPFYTKETVRFCLQNANILKLSELELAYVVETFSLGNVKMETAVKSIVKKFENIKTVLITLGENGSFAYEKTTDTFTYCQAVKVKTVSTVGAGDSFGAAFLTAYLQGENIKGALQAGASRSAIVVSQHGAIFWNPTLKTDKYELKKRDKSRFLYFSTKSLQSFIYKAFRQKKRVFYKSGFYSFWKTVL